jgi:PAS domain S-box-containing protein
VTIRSIFGRLRPDRPGNDAARAREETDPVSRAHFQRIVEIAADAIISMDESGRIVLFNRGAEEIFGYDRDQVLGEPLSLLLPERFRPYHQAHVQEFATSEVAARRMGERREIAGRRKDGREFPAEASISVLETPDGPLFTVVLRDITDRKKVEETQRFLADASAVLSRSLDFEATMEGLARLALPHLGDWCVIDVLDEDGAIRRIQAVHRDPEQEDIALGLLEFPPEPGRPHPTLTVLETGEPELLEAPSDAFMEAVAASPEHLRILRTLGLASMLVVPLVARDRTLGAFALISADPARPYTADDLVLADELGRRAGLAADNARLYRAARDAVAARDEVLSVVSHDLGNPLSAIRVSARVMGRLLNGDAVEPARAQLEGIRAAALQMERLIRDLLEIRRIESGRLKLVRRPERVEELVAEAVRSLRPLAEEQEVTLVTALDPELPGMIRVDADRVQQIFSNLIGNALKFTPAGGTITVRARARDEGVEFAVEDTGPGLSADEVEHVFDRFWQARQRGSHGIGLGLSIAKGMTEAHGGHVQVASEEGQGCRFSFLLPTDEL